MAKGKEESGTTMLTFSDGKPKLTPEVVGADVAVLTFAELNREVKTRVGSADVIVFKEYPDHWWYVNTTSLKRIAAKYGFDYAKWRGKQIVLFAHSGTVVGSNKGTVTFWAADPGQAKGEESWDALLRQAKRAK